MAAIIRLSRLSICFALMLTICLAFSSVAFAHRGRTDSYGGHKDNSNASGLGSYHYHHGYGPHLHPGGVCPYSSTISNDEHLVSDSDSLESYSKGPGVGYSSSRSTTSSSSSNYSSSSSNTYNTSSAETDSSSLVGWVAITGIIVVLLSVGSIIKKRQHVKATAGSIISLQESKLSNNPPIDRSAHSRNEQINFFLSQTAYWTPNGRSFHLSIRCKSLQNSRRIIKGTVREALNIGKANPCNFCAWNIKNYSYPKNNTDPRNLLPYR